jgi:hypothetical protein
MKERIELPGWCIMIKELLAEINGEEEHKEEDREGVKHE